MVQSMEQYVTLRQNFLKVAKLYIKDEVLIDLKSRYQDIIHSVRAFDFINNIEDLVKILEKRGVVRYDDITPLIDIARLYLGHDKIFGELNEYDKLMQRHNPHYSRQTNLYKAENGECRIEKTNDCNIYAISIGSLNHSRAVNVSQINNINSNIVCDNRDTNTKNSRIHIVSHWVYGTPQNEENNVNSHISALRSNLIFQSERAEKPPKSSHSSTEDLDKTDNTLPNSSLITRSRSVEPRVTSCSFVIDTFIQMRYVKILFITLIFVVTILSTLFIIYGSWETSVNYNTNATAPPFHDVHTGYSETSGNPDAGTSSRLNQNSYAVYNAILPTSPPLQTLSEREAKLQNKVFEIVSSKLGNFWTDVARRLDIRECDINNIDKLNPDLRSKAYAALQLFASQTDLDYWQRTLKTALEKARRKDLMEVVEELASRRF